MHLVTRSLGVFLFSLVLGCAQLTALNPFGSGSGDPADTFAIAKSAYVGAFQSAAQYVALCQSMPPTERCDKFTVKLYDDVNPRAREAIALGEGVLVGILPPGIECDAVADPGCVERLRAEQLTRFAMLLQQLAIVLNARGR
jgi:hypothetical protein